MTSAIAPVLIRRTAILTVLLAATFASAASRETTIRIKVLDSETHSVIVDSSGVPKNCDSVNFDAYCNNSRTNLVTNTLLVQVGDTTPIRIACNEDTRWSRCVPLTKGQSFDARREKRGLTVYYIDSEGKPRRQFYVLVGEDGKALRSAPSPTIATQSSQAATQPNPASDRDSSPVASSSAAPGTTQTQAVGAAENTAPTIAKPEIAKPEIATNSTKDSSSKPTVKCSFSSTPAGAEVTVDGRYVGSTPSILGVPTGNHVVVISMTGFAQWKRELAVSAGSELTVNAVLQKAQ